jgi:AraC-like DNA-binding protein
LPRSEHAFLASAVANVFQVLDVAITLWDTVRWHEIYERAYARDILGFEVQHGTEAQRIAYNIRCLQRAQREKCSVVARHVSFTDLFVPVRSEGRAIGVLATGPIAVSRPTSTDLLERWRTLTGRQGHPSDPEFAQYVAATLSTLSLDKAELERFQHLVELFAVLIAGDGDAAKLYAQIKVLGTKLAEARLADRMWEVAHAMVDQRTSRAWASPVRAPRLRAFGVERYPEQVVVGLFVDRERDAEPVDAILRGDGLQRACVALARSAGDVLSGQVGGHGITLLGAGRGSAARTQRYLLGLAERASSLAHRRFGLDLYVGVGDRDRPLDEQYTAALAAAESALRSGTHVVRASSGGFTASSLGPLRREIAGLVEDKPEALPVRFERYLEAVAVRTGHRLDLARVHLEAGFERIAEAVLGGDALDAKGFADLSASLERAAQEADTHTDLFAAYRRAVRDVVDAMAAPRSAPRDRSLRRAEEYMRKHYAETLTLARVARVAGFEPTYFSKLFHAKERVTFEGYLMRLRVERAEQLLAGTTLGLGRVAQLSGLSTGDYLGRVFKRATGETPIGYRKRARRERGPILSWS